MVSGPCGDACCWICPGLLGGLSDVPALRRTPHTQGHPSLYRHHLRLPGRARRGLLGHLPQHEEQNVPERPERAEWPGCSCLHYWEVMTPLTRYFPKRHFYDLNGNEMEKGISNMLSNWFLTHWITFTNYLQSVFTRINLLNVFPLSAVNCMIYTWNYSREVVFCWNINAWHNLLTCF